MKKILVLFLLGALKMVSQTITPQVINAAGDHRQLGNSGIYITDNVGEPFVQTVSNNNLMITQGFVQPEIISPGSFTYSPIYQGPKCEEAYDDAFISILIDPPANYKANYTTKYYWSPSGVCPNNDCAKIDTLKPGSYSVKVVISYTTNIGTPANDTIGSSNFLLEKAAKPCKVTVYNAVSPNGDAINDTWVIDNITDYPKNRVTIYSRWGKQLFDIKGYNNKDKIWPTKEMADNLESTTYFYIIELEEGGTMLKGWVEVMKNQ